MKTTLDMAREAGAIHIHDRPKEFALVGNVWLKAFEAFARADEREACAKVCETTAPSQINGYECAAAIRARGNT